MSKRFIITAVILAALLGGLAYFQFVYKPEMIKGFIAASPQPLVTVAAQPAATEERVRRVRSIGTLVAVRGIDVAPQVGGVVSELLFESGDQVEQGAKLVQLDVSVETADLERGEATLRQAELEFERQNKLESRGVTAETTLESSRAKRDEAAAGVARSQAVIEQKTITAPFAGRLGIRKAEIGQYVSPGQALVTLQSLDPIYVDFPVPEQEIDDIEPGQRLEVTVDTYPGETFTGEIETLDARLSQETRTLLVRGRLDNADRKLLPGMFANVAVLVGQAEQVVTVPRTAITYSLYGDSIYVVQAPAQGDAGQPTAAISGAGAGATASANASAAELAPSTVERRTVTVGDTLDGRVVVLDGVAAGELVVVSGQLKLQPGAKVKVDTSSALEPPAQRPKE